MIPQNPDSDLPIITSVDLSHPAVQGTYTIAKLLMKIVNWLLSLVGLQNNDTVFTVVYAIIVLGISIGIGWIIKLIVIFIVRKLSNRFHGNFYIYLTDDHFFTKATSIFPGIVFLIFIQFTLNGKLTLSSWLSRLTWIYLTFVITDTLCAVADVMWKNINARANKRKLPLNGIVQLIKGILWILCIIVSVAILLDKSPGSLLAGLAGFAAILMLIFKDSILGVVAGVQLSENDSLHVGDWIKGGGTEANGIVTEVSLTAVKVKNWDKTTTSIPPYNLVTIGFTNFMSMQNSNTRRIQRAYMIDADSVVPCDDKMLEEFSTIPFMKDWISKKIQQKKEGKEKNAGNPDGLVDGSIDTNLGVFRAYLKMWLDASNDIDHDKESVSFITSLPQTPYGIPLQIYCFTSTSDWQSYEAITSSVFEHVAAMMSKFKLYTYESPSGRDALIDGYISPGRTTADVFGIPYPFYTNSGTPSNPGIPPAGAFSSQTDGNHFINPVIGSNSQNVSETPASPANPATPATPAEPAV